MTTTFRVEGDTTLRATLKVAAHRIEDMTDPGRATGAFLATRGRADAPRRTGYLAASHRADPSATAVEVVAAAPYAGYVHYGTRHMRARPWLTTGAHNTEGTWIRNYETRIETVLAGVRGA